MKKSPWALIVFLCLVFGSVLFYFIGKSVGRMFDGGKISVGSKNSILHLKLEGMILDGKKILEPLKKFRKKDKIKAILVEINSPGGVVGPSQEIYEELKRAKDEFKKPVVVVSTGLMASGAFYAAVAADKILVAPGTLVGSIGVIMEFMNLEKLYEWAKVSRFSINTGKYKDSGAEYRQMREDEKQLFQELVDDVYIQFVEAVAVGRNLTVDKVKPWADGRVVTGKKAKEIGFVDEIGTLEDGFKLAANLGGLGEDYDIFEPPKKHPHLWDLISFDSEEDEYVKFEKGPMGGAVKFINEMALRAQLANKPLYLMPGAL